LESRIRQINADSDQFNAMLHAQTISNAYDNEQYDVRLKSFTHKFSYMK